MAPAFYAGLFARMMEEGSTEACLRAQQAKAGRRQVVDRASGQDGGSARPHCGVAAALLSTIRSTANGVARNINTIAKLAALAAAKVTR